MAVFKFSHHVDMWYVLHLYPVLTLIWQMIFPSPPVCWCVYPLSPASSLLSIFLLAPLHTTSYGPSAVLSPHIQPQRLSFSDKCAANCGVPCVLESTRQLRQCQIPTVLLFIQTAFSGTRKPNGSLLPGFSSRYRGKWPLVECIVPSRAFFFFLEQSKCHFPQVGLSVILNTLTNTGLEYIQM